MYKQNDKYYKKHTKINILLFVILVFHFGVLMENMYFPCGLHPSLHSIFPFLPLT